MRIVIQRVSRASVLINDKISRESGQGLCLFVGVHPDDTKHDVEWLASKIAGMRIFADENGKMNLSINQTGGNILLISQFTLFASIRKGNRPSFNGSGSPDMAVPLYELLIKELGDKISGNIVCGEFGADMKVDIVNDGPVTIIIDSHNRE